MHKININNFWTIIGLKTAIVFRFSEKSFLIEFMLDSPETMRNCVFPQNFHTRKLDESMVFFLVLNYSYEFVVFLMSADMVRTSFLSNVNCIEKVWTLFFFSVLPRSRTEYWDLQYITNSFWIRECMKPRKKIK